MILPLTIDDHVEDDRVHVLHHSLQTGTAGAPYQYRLMFQFHLGDLHRAPPGSAPVVNEPGWTGNDIADDVVHQRLILPKGTLNLRMVLLFQAQLLGMFRLCLKASVRVSLAGCPG